MAKHKKYKVVALLLRGIYEVVYYDKFQECVDYYFKNENVVSMEVFHMQLFGLLKFKICELFNRDRSK